VLCREKRQKDKKDFPVTLSEFFQDGIRMADSLGSTFLMNVYNVSMASKVII